VSASRGAQLPHAYRSPLLDAANSLAARIDCPPAPPPAEEPDNRGEGDEHGKGGEHRKGKGDG
jgi:hypothetical protein